MTKYISSTFNIDISCSQAQLPINAYEVLLQHDWLYFFLDIIGSQKHIVTYNFHIK